MTLWGPTFDNVIAASAFSTLQRFDGNVWSSVTAGEPGGGLALWGTSATDMLLVGGGGFAGRYTGSGEVVPIATGTTRALVSVWGSSPQNYLAGTNNGLVFRFDGTAFSPMNLPGQPSSIAGLWGVSETQVYIVDFNAAVYRYDGSQWTLRRASAGDTFIQALHGVPSRLFAVGSGGAVMVTP